MASHSQETTLQRWFFVECPEQRVLEASNGRYNSDMHFVYMITNKNNELYIGVTEDLQSRLKHHNSNQGAQFTKHTDIFEIVFTEEYKSLTEARKREIQLKKWRREKKELLIKKFQLGFATKSDA